MSQPEQETDSPDSSERVLFTTIEQGQASRFSEDNRDVQPVFSNPETWQSFWEAYTEGREPRPELPYIDFNSEMVIVSSLSEISDVYVDRNQGTLRVIARDFNPQATTPFHIIKTGKVEFQLIVFEHPNPPENLLTGEEKHDGTDINATATPDVEAAVPNCVELTQWDSFDWLRGWKSHARAINSCGHSVRFRMIWAWAGDGSCQSVSKSWYEERGGRAPYVSELRSC